MATQSKQYRVLAIAIDYLTAKGEWKHAESGDVVSDLLPQTAAWMLERPDIEEVSGEAPAQAPTEEGGEG